jgi:hypothetical protein
MDNLIEFESIAEQLPLFERRSNSALTPELKDWVDHVIVPALVARFVAERVGKSLRESDFQLDCARQNDPISAEVAK